MEFKLVYGNHGRDPFHIMDTLLLVKFSLEALGHKADLEEFMTPGKTNVLLECFTYDFLEVYKDFHQAPGTDYLIIATEYLTGNSFNQFASEPGEADTHYAIPSYWQKRFRTFRIAEQYARAVWHLSENQVTPFGAIATASSVHYLPHGYVEGFARIRNKPAEHQDIDAIFTGTLTKYRLDLIEQMKASGLKVQACKPINTMLREDLVARSKLGLNLKQAADWQYASNSRYHYHLSNNSLLVSEACPIPCDLSRYVVEAEPAQLAATCHELISGGRHQQVARDRLERFMGEMPMPKLMEELLDATYAIR